MNAAILNVLHRIRVSRAGLKPLITFLAGARTLPDVEVFEPQGLHFRAPVDAQGVLASPQAAIESGVVLGLHGTQPPEGEGLAPGEGGLHYLGTWKVFLQADGNVVVGGGSGEGDYVALSTLVAAELQDLSDRIAVFERVFAAWTPVALDGGAALKTAYTADPGTPGAAPGSVAATKARAV